MSNGFNKKPTDLPQPNEENKSHVQTKGWINAQLLSKLAAIFLSRIRIAALFTASIIARLLRLPSKLSRRMKSVSAIATLVTTAVLAGHTVSAQVYPGVRHQPLASLKSVPIPEPDNLSDFIKDKTAAIALGKSLFWDMQLGSDGVMSCATCHYHAGADNRSKNQISPASRRVNADGTKNEDTTFETGGGPNYQLTAADYPFHKLADPDWRSSTVVSDSNNITGSQGVFKTKFEGIVLGSDKDNVTLQRDDIFNVKGINVRQVTDRNTPSAINAAFNFRNFWDGRAQDIFNGVNPFGLRDPNAFVLKATSADKLQQVKIQIKNSSLASQAVGPPTSEVEQSGGGRTLSVPENSISLDSGFSDAEKVNAGTSSGQELGQGSIVDRQLETFSSLFDDEEQIGPLLPKQIGKKMLSLTPLNKQLVARDDSVLGSYSQWPATGLNRSYSSLIQTAFKPEWWNSNLIVSFEAQDNGSIINKPDRPLTTKEVTLMEFNFSLFFGLALQAYESTLISNNAPIDQYLEGNRNALTTAEQRGLEIFQSRGTCITCHGGAEFTNASVQNVQNERLKRMRVAGGDAVYDNGFYNIGVRPTLEDLGVGGSDKFGNPLSEARLAQQQQFQGLLGEEPNIDVGSNQRIAADGAFKTPGLRNVELTAPYFHNGGQLTLEQVVDFYDRGGDFSEENRDNLDADIRSLNLSAQNKADLVAFLKALTDDRVRYEKAPFDHPQLFIPNGHPGNQNAVTNDGTGKASDSLLELPAVGRQGLSMPPKNFLE